MDATKDKDVIGEVAFSNSPFISKSVQFTLQPNDVANKVANKFAEVWNRTHNDVFAMRIGRSVYFSGTVTSMGFKEVGAPDSTPVPADHSAKQVVDGLFVSLGY